MDLQDIRYWLEDLELRKKLEENQSIVIGGLCVIILFSLGLVTCHLLGGPSQASYTNSVELVYFDTETKTIKLVEHEYPAIPASPLEGQENVYLASVYACEECPKGAIKDGMTLEEIEEEGMFIAWIERIDPNATDEMALFGEGYSYRLPDKDKWYSSSDPGYQKIIRELYERCPKARVCLP